MLKINTADTFMTAQILHYIENRTYSSNILWHFDAIVFSKRFYRLQKRGDSSNITVKFDCNIQI